MKNTITDLRNHLFETLEALKDRDQPMEIARAKTIADVAQVVINSAKVEVDFMKVTDATSSGRFFATPQPDEPLKLVSPNVRGTINNQKEK